MKTAKLILAFCLVAISFSGFGSNPVKDLLGQADQAKKNFQDFKAIDYYQQVLNIDSNNFEALWNISYLYSRNGWLDRNTETRIKYNNLACQYAEKTYRKYPNTFEANFVMAGSIARRTEFESAKDRVHSVWDIKKYADVALSMKPDNPEVWYMLGWWNFEIAKATWLERSLAKVFFGGLPNTSYDEAIKCLKKAMELKPNYTVYFYDLATFYEQVGNISTAIKLCKQAMNFIPTAPEDFLYINFCKSLISKLSDM